MLQSALLLPVRAGITREDDIVFRDVSFKAFSTELNTENTISFRCDSAAVGRTVVPLKDEAGESNFTVSFCTTFPRILRAQKNSFIEMRNRNERPTLNIEMLISDPEMDFILAELRRGQCERTFLFMPDVETDSSAADGDVLLFPALVALNRGSGWSGRCDVSYYSFGSTLSN